MPRKEAEMSFTRRAFVKAVGIGGASVLAARREAWATLVQAPGAARPPRALLLHNNENPLGPGEAALEAVRSALGQGGPAGRYSYDLVPDLHRAIADRFGVSPENVVTGCGSTQVLRVAVQVFTSPATPMVAGQLTYEECAGYADLVGTPVRAIPLDRTLQLDLGAMANAAAQGAGMVFLNNPNNPTASLLPGDAVDAFIEQVHSAAPDAMVLIDEAYHDYVTDSSHRTQIARAVKDPRVVVARTFSKAHGMAGMRVGYAIGHPETIKRLSWEGPNALNVAGIVAATASIKDQARLEREKARNTEARGYTIDWFSRAGFTGTDSQTNFVFMDIKRPAKGFRDSCREQGVLVARDFPPLQNSHVRISIGTLDEMKRATEVFGKVLGVKAKAA
jgi:histidinol-phosphate aminotransferase